MEYGLIGGKLGQSFSPYIHQTVTKEDYGLKELAPEEVEGFLKERAFKGINVTIPYKQTVIPFLDVVDPIVERIGACNTIVNKDGKLYGYNTDYFGFKELIIHNHIMIKNKKCLILGTGGTSKTVKCVLEDLGAKEIKKASRTQGDVTYDDLSSVLDYEVIVNTTPVGMWPNIKACPLDITPFKKVEALLDVVYNPIRTLFIQAGLERKIKAVSGLRMLVKQAIKSAELFRDITYKDETSKITDALAKSIRNIVFMGMPSCGKSALGKIISSKYKLSWYDTDTLIEQEQGTSIKTIFSEHGEPYFRELEAKKVEEVALNKHSVISIGGGTILNPTSVKLLKANGILVWINRPLEQLQATSSRPLSKDKEAIKELYKVRRPIYEHNADFVLMNDISIDDAAWHFKQYYEKGLIK